MKTKEKYLEPVCEYFAAEPGQMIATSAPNLWYGDPFLN